MDFEEIGINAGNWVDSARDRGPLINYATVPRERGVGKNLYILLLCGEGGVKPILT